jgi:AbrB family looped-hinge helix DNA binding protein
MEVGVMETVTVSPKYQIVIPRMVREALGIKPGQKVQVLQYQNRIEFIPLKRMKEMRGFLKGINSTVEREKDRL